MVAIHIVVYFLLYCEIVYSFDGGWTHQFLPTKDATHYSITECALLATSSEYLKRIYSVSSVESTIDIEYGRCQARSIYKAINSELDKLKIEKSRLSSTIKTIAEANRKLDVTEAFKPETHFHDETFDAGAMLISQRLDATISNIQMQQFEQAKVALGALLHTVQDFYSHSNWIENGHRVPNEGMGKYQHLGKYAPKDMRTCVNCADDSCRTNIVPSMSEDNILTSGYFSTIFGSKKKPIGKCSHGNIFDTTTSIDAKGGGINKDTLTSDHGHLHKEAASVAYDATIQLLNDIWKKVNDSQFGQFLGLAASLRNVSSSSLVIAIDTTGSMAIRIVDIHQTFSFKPINYILSPFNDPEWGPLSISTTPEEFKNRISNLSAYGGGDEPELYYHGMIDAFKAAEIGSSVYAFTDAPAKDAQLKPEAVYLAKEKRLTVTLFYASIYHRQVQNDHRLLNESFELIESLTVSDGNDLPSITGGVIMGIDSKSLEAVENYIIERLNTSQRETLVFSAGFNTNFTIYTDVSIKSLRIEITSNSMLTTEGFRLMKPTGEILSLAPTSQTPFILIYTIPVGSHDIGQWTIMSNMNVDHNVQVTVTSEVACSSTLQRQILNSISNTSFTSLTTKPIKGESHLYVFTICDNLPGELRTGRIDVVDAKNGANILQSLTPTQVSSTGFLSKITVPDTEFRLSTTVELEDGSKVKRQEREVVSPTAVSLTVNDQPYFVLLNDTLAMNYTIFNHGSNPVKIQLRAKDDFQLLSSVGVERIFNISAMHNITGTIIMNTKAFNKTNSNMTMITDSVLFTISANDHHYEEAAFVYIQTLSTPLVDQDNYQKPPPWSNSCVIVESSVFWIQLLAYLIMELLRARA